MHPALTATTATHAGLAEVEAYLARHKPFLFKKCHAFARRAFEEIHDMREQAALLQLVKDCPLPARVTLAEVDDAYTRGGDLGPRGLATLDAGLGHVWRGYGNKLGLSGVPPARHAAVRRWFYAALVLANDELLAASTVH